MWNNQVSLSGYLTANVKEVSKTEKDDSVVHFTIGVSRINGDTDFIRCTAFRHNADYMAKYGRKGSLVTLTGNLKTSVYEKDDTQRHQYEVIADSVHIHKKQEQGDPS